MIARFLLRFAILAVVVGLFTGLAAVLADSVRPPRPNRRGELRLLNRRPAQPQPRRLPSFAGEVLLIGGIALAGRKLFRIRLNQ